MARSCRSWYQTLLSVGKLRTTVAAIVVAVSLVVSSYVSMAVFALPGDYAWQSSSAGITGDVMSWKAIASSSNGVKLAAVVDDGYIYTSSDSGATWAERTSPGLRYWQAIAMSSDGTKLAAYGASASNYTGNSSYIYTSSDSGVTWSERTGTGQQLWQSVTVSGDGTKLYAQAGSSLYVSTDMGATWNQRTLPIGASSFASNSNGSTLAIAAPYDYVYTSTDSGVTWTQ